MSRFLLVVLALTFTLAGCASLADKDRYFLQSYAVAPPTYKKMAHRKRLLAEDIIALVQAGVPGPYIEQYLRRTKSHCTLSAEEVFRLRQLVASDGLIRYLTAPPEKPGRRGEAWWYQNSAS